jgi:hypothetical protein
MLASQVPTKSKSSVYNYYAGYKTTLAVEGLSKVEKQHAR